MLKNIKEKVRRETPKVKEKKEKRVGRRGWRGRERGGRGRVKKLLTSVKANMKAKCAIQFLVQHFNAD